MRRKIIGGRLFDPVNGWEGLVQDLYIDNERLVDHLPEVDQVIDARGQVVVPGGIELRGRVAGYGLHYLRLWHQVPTLKQWGEAYAALGYTHVHEPFLTLPTANYVHRELAALPLVDTSASLVINLRDFDLWLKSAESLGEVAETLLVLLQHTRTLDLRVQEPFVRYQQDFYAPRTLTLDKTLEVLAALSQKLALKISLEPSPELLRATLPEPRWVHLAALGSVIGNEATLEAALMHLEKGATADMGLLPLNVSESCQDPPIRVDLGFFQPLDLCPTYPPGQGKQALELALRHFGRQLAFSAASLRPDPAAHFPLLFSWLLDHTAAQETWGTLTNSREYSLSEWVWATRTLPAQILGLSDRGHLSPGARADMALYDLPPQESRSHWSACLSRCRTLIKAGEVIIEDFHLVKPGVKKTTWFRETDLQPGPLLAEICQHRSFRPEHLWVSDAIETSWGKI